MQAIDSPVINYKSIADAIDYYSSKGYQYIGVPWLVSETSINITKPKDRKSFSTFAGDLVASGEQSFIEIRKDLCPGRKYQCVTPCFRDEFNHDELHLRCFIKCELIIPLWKGDEPEKFLKIMLDDAKTWFSRYGDVKVLKTNEGFDIEIAGIEVGSYGSRKHEDFRWIYGTGLAEPRINQVFKKLRDSNGRVSK